MSFQTTSGRTRERAQQLVLFVLGTALLLLTWLLLYMAIGSFTLGWLDAWGSSPVSDRPPVGIWQRTLSDNPDQFPTVLQPGNWALVIGLLLLVFRMMRDRGRAWIPLEFAALNLIFFMAILAAGIFVFLPLKVWVSELRPSLDIGYPGIWPVIVIEAVLLFTLLVAQARGWLRKWLLRGGAVRGAIIGTPSGAIVFAAGTTLVALLEGGRVLASAGSGAAEGAVVGIVVGAMAGTTSRRSVAILKGAVVGALIGWIPAEPLDLTLIGAVAGAVVGMIAGGESGSQASQ
jgi:hypothetical protein